MLGTTLLYIVMPALLGGAMGAGAGYALSRLDLSPALVTLMPWRTLVTLLVLWLGFLGLPVVNWVGLGPDAAIVSSALLGLVLALPAALSAMLERTPTQRLISTLRGLLMVAVLLGVNIAWQVGGGGLGLTIYTGVNAVMWDQVVMGVIQLTGLLLVLDLVGGVIEWGQQS